MRRTLTALVASAAAAALTVAGCAADGAGRVISGVRSDPARSVAGLALPDVTAGNADFEFVAPPGGFLVVYFGYTTCPDVCPTTMYEVEKALRLLGERADAVRVAMITIDPERDTAESFPGYVRGFVADGHALRTDDDAELRTVADAFGADYSVTPVPGGQPEVSHTPLLYLVDDTGDLVLTWPFGLTGDTIAADIEILLEAS